MDHASKVNLEVYFNFYIDRFACPSTGMKSMELPTFKENALEINYKVSFSLDDTDFAQCLF